MRKIYPKLILLSPLLLLQTNLKAQCGSPLQGGTATNMFTQIRNPNNPVAADKDLNTVIFIHRNNVTTFGGNSGNLRYDISTNGGGSWTIDQGVLNPVSTNLARYPNVTIYNPPANTSTANAYLGYLAGTIDPSTSAWNGMVTGVRKLTGTGNTESYNQPAIVPNNVPASVVRGAPGVFWGVDDLLNASLYPVSFTIYKGVWNNTTSDITWTSNYSAVPPFNTAYAGSPVIGEYHIAFDPTGTYGWMSFSGHVTPGPAGYALYPVFYKTVNGGSSWTGPIQVDLNQFGCMTANIATGNIVGTNGEHNLTVDMNGNPHFFTPVVNGSNSYGVYYGSWHHMYDITMDNGNWVAYDIGNVMAAPNTWGTGANLATQSIAPQISRTRDGKKIFYSWTDNTTYTVGTVNATPDLFSMGFDVQTKLFTNLKSFSACNPSTAGKILFPHLAEEALEPSAGNYKLAIVYGELGAAQDPGQTSNFKFLNNATYTNSDFTVPAPSIPVSITQGSTLLACPGTTVNLSLNGTYSSILWSNGNTTASNAVSQPGTYSVLVSNGCSTGTSAIAVSTFTFNGAAVTPSVCPGGSATLTASGGANAFSWFPGNQTGTTAVYNPVAPSVYTLYASGNGCTSTATVNVGIYPPPVISVSGSTAVCAGLALTQTVSGASTYSWASGETSPAVSFTPALSTTYTVFGFDANNCSDTALVNITLNPSPTVNASASSSIICKGQSATLTAHGANSYSWAGSQTTATIAITPSVTSTYSVTGINSFSCANTATFTEEVSLCTGINKVHGAAAAISAAPNPTGGRFTITTQNRQGGELIEIYTCTGQKIMQALLSTTDAELDLSEQPAGIYFIYMSRNGEHVANSKIIKE